MFLRILYICKKLLKSNNNLSIHVFIITGPYFARFDHKFYDAAGTSYQDQPWTVSVTNRLLQNEPDVLALFGIYSLIEPKPKYVRALLYKFQYTTTSDEG